MPQADKMIAKTLHFRSLFVDGSLSKKNTHICLLIFPDIHYSNSLWNNGTENVSGIRQMHEFFICRESQKERLLQPPLVNII